MNIESCLQDCTTFAYAGFGNVTCLCAHDLPSRMSESSSGCSGMAKRDESVGGGVSLSIWQNTVLAGKEGYLGVNGSGNGTAVLFTGEGQKGSEVGWAISVLISLFGFVLWAL